MILSRAAMRVNKKTGIGRYYLQAHAYQSPLVHSVPKYDSKLEHCTISWC